MKISMLVVAIVALFTVHPAAAQSRAITASGGAELLNQYMFRGIRQHSTGVAFWPWADLGLEPYSGNGRVKSLTLNIGTWNSLHSGDTGTDGPSAKRWYESDFYAAVGMGLGGGVAVATTYTAYTSPNASFSTVKELMVKLSVDDSTHMGKAAMKPYAIVAREFDTAPGLGQADGGTKGGTYLEFGIAPGYAGSKASLTVPVKLGLSLDDYFEASGIGYRFGFFSVAGIVTVPLADVTSRFGSWNLHGGVEFQKLGDATALFNGGDRSKVIASIGFGFSY